MKIPKLATALLLAASILSSAQQPDGEQLHTLNCAACHLLDQGLVGPSLVEIRKLYLDKPDDFVKWALAPGKKRPGAVDMPAMIHVGEPGLRAIHAHMMKIAEGAKEKKIDKGDPFLHSPTQAVRPQIQRIFLPNAGPAAIAIALDDQVSLCWDAGECRFRYAWTGGFIDGYPYWKGNGSSVAQIKGKVRYTETTPLFPGTPSFKGYEIKNKLPVFHYTIGGIEISETFEALPDGKGFKRHITSTSKPAVPESDGKAKLSIEGTASDFTLTCTFE